MTTFVHATVKLPADLVRAARTRAAERGEPFDDLIARAVSREVGLPAGRRLGARVTLPLVGVGAEPTVSMSDADLAAILTAEDAEKYGSG